MDLVDWKMMLYIHPQYGRRIHLALGFYKTKTLTRDVIYLDWEVCERLTETLDFGVILISCRLLIGTGAQVIQASYFD